jgi:hypothetical protein
LPAKHPQNFSAWAPSGALDQLRTTYDYLVDRSHELTEWETPDVAQAVKTGQLESGSASHTPGIRYIATRTTLDLPSDGVVFAP